MPGTSAAHQAKQRAALRAALGANPQADGATLARLSGVPIGSVYRILATLRKPVPVEPAPAPKRASLTTTGNEAAAEVVSPNVRTLEELLSTCKVDLAVWEVERHVINKWEVAMKVGGGGKVSALHRPLFQIKAWLRRKQPVIDAQAAAALFSAELTRAVRPLRLKRSAGTTGALYEVSIPDLHLGKLAWHQETGHGDYDSDIAARIWREALTGLLEAAPAKVGQFLLPIGNDFFNVDGDSKQTTAGTPQDEDGRWQKSFKAGTVLCIDAIRQLATIAPVQVVMVAGNHDYQRVYYLGAVLEAAFADAKHVTIDNSPTARKYVAWGETLLGFTHGDKEKQDDLPLIMATERPALWSASTVREWHLGHEHKEKVRTKQGVTVRVIPSLCPPESWHAGRGYIGNPRQACAFAYDRQGLLSQHYFTVRG